MFKNLIICRLGKDPEQKSTGNGKSYSIISVAIDGGKKKDGTKKTTWVTVFFWDKLAELAQRYLHKGSLVYVECSMSTNEKGYLLNAKQLIFLDQGKNASSSSANNTPSDQQNQGLNTSANHTDTNTYPTYTSGLAMPVDDFDEMPF